MLYAHTFERRVCALGLSLVRWRTCIGMEASWHVLPISTR